MSRLPVFATLLAAFLLAPASLAQIRAVEAFPGIRFDFPVEVAVAPGQPERLYVVEKGEGSTSPEAPSRILSIAPGETEPTVFLDLTDVAWPGAEAGLLGLAFHPDYASNGRFFVYYGARGVQRTVLAEYRRSARDPLVADPDDPVVLLEVEQPLTIHNGGKIKFGPDGFLYVAYGDGRGPGDVDGNGQNLATLLGSLVRIDVDGTTGSLPYRIPADNPFLDVSGARPEIYARGFRSPWKFTFDAETGDLWLGDVGETDWEEINVVEAGGNYGWGEMEGFQCFVDDCDPDKYDLPLYAYPHTAETTGGLSITGGFVYRGTALAGLQGRYLFADFVFPRLWALLDDASGADVILNTVPNIASINADASGEVLLTSFTEGKIYKVVQGPLANGPGATDAAPTLALRGANPVRSRARLAIGAAAGTSVRVTAFDARGRELAVVYDGAVSAGDLEVELDASGFAPGAVFVRLDAASGRVVLPLTVVR
ncbi:PQQ-dependent sugar dehydrogenase [Rubricoccus marinus]|uniref:Glucose/Sorbosone dehydrogenase domain-containing protein n=1 Tax=Rubricoccus marinus TaxID=716817 RepID=A0A259TV62_9BACT|nr:PQQ-dependent sugar dehydrogenase [Rubricoccus marinus]OZC01633.1 hypothetical protein BSZ36_00730 [Rubricoccus marinus]